MKLYHFKKDLQIRRTEAKHSVDHKRKLLFLPYEIYRLKTLLYHKNQPLLNLSIVLGFLLKFYRMTISADHIQTAY